MSRPPKIPGKPYKTTVSTKLNEPATQAFDQMRGDMKRSEFLRELIRRAWGEYQRTHEIPRGKR